MKKQSSLSFITWLRACSAIFILLCHYCSRCSHPLVAMMAMVFNIGVHLFFLMSGFLVGYKGIPKSYTAWYKRRIKRIFIPFWSFLLVLAIVHTTRNLSLLSADWLYLVLGLQGTVVNVWGAEQTWFISVLLLCYLFSPVILSAIRMVSESSNSWLRESAIAVVCAMPIVYALFEEPWIYTVFTPVSLYIMACVYGVYYNPEKHFTSAKTLLAVFVVAISFGIRFVARIICDGTIRYDRIAVPYSQSVAAFAIFYVFEAFFRDRKAPKPIRFISDISFEVYLYHYMFVQGPVEIFGQCPNWVVGCIAVTAVVLPLSYVSNRISAVLSGKRLKKP